MSLLNYWLNSQRRDASLLSLQTITVTLMVIDPCSQKVSEQVLFAKGSFYEQRILIYPSLMC